MPRTHIVKQGQGLARIARIYGIADWHVIYNDPANAEFRKKRPNPEVIYPGDRIIIPDPVTKSAPVEEKKDNGFVANISKSMLQVKVERGNGLPLDGWTYRLTVGAAKSSGTVPSNGMVSCKVDPAAKDGELVVEPPSDTREEPYRFRLKISFLDPESSTSGVQGRLNNLGIDSGAVDGKQRWELEQAVIAFRLAHMSGTAASPTVDDAVRQKLRELHGC